MKHRAGFHEFLNCARDFVNGHEPLKSAQPGAMFRILKPSRGSHRLEQTAESHSKASRVCAGLADLSGGVVKALICGVVITASAQAQQASHAAHASQVSQVSQVSQAGTPLAENSLAQRLDSIAGAARGTVSVACAVPGMRLDCARHAEAHAPMQSVFKLPLAVTILHQVEQGRLSLGQMVRFRPEDRILPETYSGLQDKYPQGGVDVSVQTLLQAMLTASDNVAADMLLRLAGGPLAVDGYLVSLGVEGFHLQDGEHALNADEALQYRNWFEPVGAVQLLLRISDDSPLTPEHTRLLLGWMRVAVRIQRLQALLPAGTVVAHRGGTSGESHGVAAATNDIGLIALPDGRQLAVAVFVTDARADMATRERVIEETARAIYDAAIAVAGR